jgi:hypothetical protein
MQVGEAEVPKHRQELRLEVLAVAEHLVMVLWELLEL